MAPTFSKVLYDPKQAEIAKVNRDNGTLSINSSIWKGLPDDQREFVLLHEKAHLELKTADEFEANKYAVKNFAPAGTLTNGELGKRIVVMRNILTPQQQPESGFGFDPASAIAGAIGSVAQVLPVLGIGSGARIKETQAQAALIEAQAAASAKKTNSYIMFGVIGGVLLIVMITLYFTLRK